MLDLAKAFEMVPHARLVDAARRRGYPLKLLTAGSGFATTELRLLLMDVMDGTDARW